MIRKTASFATGALFALTLAAVPAPAARAQSKAEFETLKKRIEELEAKTRRLEEERAADAPASAAAAQENKVKLSDSVTELRLYGDLRFRYQYDQFDQQLHAPGAAPFANVNQRSRERFRLRLSADFKLGEKIFGGVQLATGQQADSNMETFTGGYDNYAIFITKAFLGYQPGGWLTVILGKQANPFYTTSLVWDPDINPQGLVEIFDVGKAFLPADSPLSLQLIGGQFVFFDNNEFNLGHDASTDVFQFVEQVKASWKFDKDTSLTFAPGFMSYTAGDLTGLRNARAFSKPQDLYAAVDQPVQTQTITTRAETVTISYDAKGVPSRTVTPLNVTTTVTTTNPAGGSPRTVKSTATSRQQQVKTAGNAATGLPGIPVNPKLANRTFTTTKTLGSGSIVVNTPANGAGGGGESRDLAILTAPGDFSFKLRGFKTKLYWDFAYNTQGGARYRDIYGLAGHATRDDISWLAGAQIGENKRAGDWSLFADYREIGVSSIDPNLNDSDFALSALNVRGVKTGLVYNLTDAVIGAVTYSHAWNLKENLTGGQATGGAGIADINSVDVLQVDLNIKF